LLFRVIVRLLVICCDLVTTQVFLYFLPTLFTFNKSLKHKLSEVEVLGFVLVYLRDALNNFIQIFRELYRIVTLNWKLFKARHCQ